MGVDWAAEGLLDGLDPGARSSRAALLDELHERGVDVAELRRATEQGELVFTLAGVTIGIVPTYTWEEMVQHAGAPSELAELLARTNGLTRAAPGERWYTDHDVEALRRVREFLAAGVPVEEATTLARILGRAMAQAAEVMRAMVLKMVLEPGLDEHELAVRYARLAGEFTPAMEPLLGNLLRQHLRQVTYSEVMSAQEREAGHMPGARPATVAFADLVGFTRLGEQVPPDELGAVAGRLEDLVVEVVEPPVRFVKTIGDAAMLVAPEAEPLLTATLALVAAAEAQGEDFPQLRAGLAAGEALGRAGDWFGRPVNLASRVTGIARPGSVLATAEVHDAAPDAFRWSKAGIRPIKGVPDPVALWRVRPREDPGGTDPR